MSWLLDGKHPGWPLGQPFGDGSERWRRARADNDVPWDENCYVTPLIGGQATMDEIRNAFEGVIADAEATRSQGAGDTDCHVYIAGWRLNPNRDMSVTTDDWMCQSTLTPHQRDNTAWGLIRRMMFAGVKVRILLWLPPTKPGPIEDIIGLNPHVHAHFYLSRLVKRGNQEAKIALGLPNDHDDLGVVFLDTRCKKIIGSHHQKFIIVRGITTNVAFCGGVDLAYTRRNAPFFEGDWQSGNNIPPHGMGIKERVNPVIDWESEVAAPPEDENQKTDLPEQISDIEMYGTERQIWHDQHLKLEGPVVKTLEHVFVERWSDPAEQSVFLQDNDDEMPNGSILSSSAAAIEIVRLRRTHTMDDRGNKPYFIGHSVVKTDLVEVHISGRPQRLFGLKVRSPGLSFPQADGGQLRQWRGKTLEILYKTKIPKPLPEPAEVPPVVGDSAIPENSANVQVWLTIPLRGEVRGGWEDPQSWVQLSQTGVDESRIKSLLTYENGQPAPPYPYRLGEFSIMAGVANACKQATELIWIFDQYFWSVPYARLLAKRLKDVSGLRVIIVVPPFSDLGDGFFGDAQHRLRWEALQILGASSISDNVAVYFPWYRSDFRNIGIYCHAKVQLFDDKLLVCGSCNINERGYGVDSEICCAVKSEQVVQKYYERLWNHFVDDPHFDKMINAQNFATGWGETFFNQLGEKLSLSGSHYLRNDYGHCSNIKSLPNGIVRTASQVKDIFDEYIFDPISNPHALDYRLYLTNDLEEIVDTIERFNPSKRRSKM